MDKFERGKLVENGMYDGRFWISDDDWFEMVVRSTGLLYDKITAEKYNKIIDELNSLGCTSFIMNSEQIKALMEHSDM